ncbi:hypothetical protein KIH86_17350 [Paenibacillus sp. HN-1]|uniref:hypothetical protein n=1 Tax=Paenibacillus TaxID=44249 RepID=UPI001CA7D7B9|nr:MULTISPECIES: hypothetical protein [Paenibacillus]MBY9081865.1 hypothetical protein [Paenibacillus sp. CGMCC 1.18879]MBY9085977.1 hypothetical protein [Paenibacillus sinensis]
MSQQPFDIQVKFACHQCGQEIRVKFGGEPVLSINCASCHHTFTVMRPAIAEEILIDWKNEALIQKIRADQTQSNNASLMMLIIQVIELLTWRDDGAGQIEAIKVMRQWLVDNEAVPAIAELMRTNGSRRHNKRH